AHQVFVRTRLQHLTGDLRPDDHVVAHAARLAVVVNEAVTAGHPFEEVLVADLPLPGQDVGQLQGILGGLPVVFRLSFVHRRLLLMRRTAATRCPQTRISDLDAPMRILAPFLRPFSEHPFGAPAPSPAVPPRKRQASGSSAFRSSRWNSRRCWGVNAAASWSS